ncbi:hypothetical protein [Streptomyces sp. NBC_01304]|uniref:hypothetical protein n=1 Tax=Streptomyces sp. NBC_01304 TaxID=2903818 RepID=UPI002E1667C2|nr:hypothetical protein OG430_49205 [Streptomyces sp. NBC_01304]
MSLTGADQQTYNDMRSALDLLAGEQIQQLSDAFLQHVLTTAPSGLRGDAMEWGWDDTEVRQQLARHVSQILLGRRWPKPGEGIELESFIGGLMTAHQDWCTRRSPTTDS